MRRCGVVVLLICLTIVVANELPALWELAQNNLVGVRLSRALSVFPHLDVWNAPAKWDTHRTELDQLRVFCTTADRSQRGSYLLGLCGWVVGDLDLARQSFALARSSRPDLAGLFEGRVYDYTGDKALAVSTWESAGALSHLRDRAYVWRLQGRFAQAIGLYETLVSGQPDSLDLKLELVGAYVDAQDYGMASVVLDSVLSQEPDNFEAQSLSMYVLAFGEDRSEDALLVGQRLLSMPGASDERRARVYWMLGTIERHIGNTQAAVDYFIQYRDLHVSPSWYGNFVIAQTYRLGGDLDEAWAYIERALSEVPDQPLCLSERGIILLQSGQVEPGLADLQSAVELQPDNVGLRVSIAMELHWLGQTAPACEMLQEAFELDPTNELVIQTLQECP